MSLFTFALDQSEEGPTNMARDIALLDAAEQGQPGCRVYSWNGPWVSLGRFQRPADALVDPEHTNFVIRPTGGKAVLHGHDVTVGLALPIPSPNGRGPVPGGNWGEGIRPSIKKAYTEVTKPLIAAMRACGLPATLAADTKFAGRGPRVADCFAHISPNDIVDERTGIKVCGCALRLTQSAVLIQASIPAGKPLVDASRIIRDASPQPRITWQPAGFPDALKSALHSEFGHAFGQIED